MTKPSGKVKRIAFAHVWIGEVAHIDTGWYTLWTTCRQTKHECQVAMKDHPQHLQDFYRRRIVKFARVR